MPKITRNQVTLENLSLQKLRQPSTHIPLNSLRQQSFPFQVVANCLTGNAQPPRNLCLG